MTEQILHTVRKTGRKADLWPSLYDIPESDTYTENSYEHHNYYRGDPSSYLRSTNHPSYEPHDRLGYNNNNGHEYDYYRYGQGYTDDYEVDDDYEQNYPLRRNSMLQERSNAMFSDENVNACSIM